MLRWEDSVKRDERKAGEGETGRRRQGKEEGGKRLSDEVVNTLRAAPHP